MNVASKEGDIDGDMQVTKAMRGKTYPQQYRMYCYSCEFERCLSQKRLRQASLKFT